MQRNLEKLREEIQSYLESHGIAVFHGAPAAVDDECAVYWDSDARPDYREFLAAADAAGARMVALWAEEFDEETIDEALKRLSNSSIAGSERTAMERRLREMRRYDGVICRIEMSFDHAPRAYVFQLRADWFRELDDMLEQIEGEEDLPEPPQAGYFSKN
jgi:hypothetical protein